MSDCGVRRSVVAWPAGYYVAIASILACRTGNSALLHVHIYSKKSFLFSGNGDVPFYFFSPFFSVMILFLTFVNW